MSVRDGTEPSAAPAEDLRIGKELGVDLKPDDWLESRTARGGFSGLFHIYGEAPRAVEIDVARGPPKT